ncbi:MAG TPA: HAMP domain-containing sensor histidine kinase [Verrucomicrobiae bacterium]|nr:HAMP domain-containing sensor histidine kinase [Verrucomicrobiae bacterium]
MDMREISQQQLLRSRWLAAGVIGVMLAVMAGTIFLARSNLRQKIREQLANEDGKVLHAVAQWQRHVDETEGQTISSLDDPAEQFDLMMKISRLKGVLSVQLFTPTGECTNAFPAYVPEARLAKEDLAKLKNLQPVSHFRPAAPLSVVNLLAEAAESSNTVPLLEVNIPLHRENESRLAGVGQFIIQGEDIAREYAELDRNLFQQAAIAFCAGGGILALVLALSFHRIQKVNRQLSERTERLTQANQELVLVAKTTAVGAVTSHLIHGLKNPLSGLQGFMKSHLPGETAGGESDWEDAAATAQRMQALINGVARVLEEQQSVAHYEVSIHELIEIISASMLPVARGAGVHFYAHTSAEGTLANRDANLTILILENLIQNAFQATPEGKSVRLEISRVGDKIACDVSDEGQGLPPELQARLFTPCRSTKPGGSGIGLAISKQLAAQIGAVLELKSSSEKGCVFRLSLPQKLASAQDLITSTILGI